MDFRKPHFRNCAAHFVPFNVQVICRQVVGSMRRHNISLFNLFAIVACIILFVVSIYERHRSNEVGTKYAICAQERQCLNRELQLQFSISRFEQDLANSIVRIDGAAIIPIGSYRAAANMRNSQGKLVREKTKLNAMRKSLD